MRGFVFGWYGHGNLGDEAFKPAIQSLLPGVDLTFGDHLPYDINTYDFLWIGGGSFLESPISGASHVNIPIGFVGVGLSNALHKSNRLLLKKADLVLVRDSLSKDVWTKATVVPDLVFLTDTLFTHCPQKKITILMNDFITPTESFPDWKFIAYYWFVSEFGGVCNDLIAAGYSLQFLPMGVGGVDDRRCAAAIVGRIRNKSNVNWMLEPVTSEGLLKEISESEFVITMRFHGMVYSTLVGTPFICIHSHDKMLSFGQDVGWEGLVNYYGFTKQRFMEVLSKIPDNELLKIYTSEAKSHWQSTLDTQVSEFLALVSQNSLLRTQKLSK